MKVASAATTAPENPLQARALRAGAQFEAILLNMVFSGLRRAFTELPGAQPDPINRSYDGFAMEALTSGLAQNGGIGLGAFIARGLVKDANESPGGI